MDKITRWLIWLTVTAMITIGVGQVYMAEGRKLGRVEAKIEYELKIMILEQQLESLKKQVKEARETKQELVKRKVRSH